MKRRTVPALRTRHQDQVHVRRLPFDYGDGQFPALRGKAADTAIAFFAVLVIQLHADEGFPRCAIEGNAERDLFAVAIGLLLRPDRRRGDDCLITLGNQPITYGR